MYFIYAHVFYGWIPTYVTCFLYAIPFLPTLHPWLIHILTPTPHLSFPKFDNLISIKLDGYNYRVWKSQMDSMFICYHFLGFVDGILSCPPKDHPRAYQSFTLNPYILSWIKTDHCIRTWITSTLTYSIHKEVHDLRTSTYLFQALLRWPLCCNLWPLEEINSFYLW